ncbi:hypothetical protein EYF80_030031 [Liparis tanakae]|uniref:Uncharacterized protein n=1 Tax=Liparis tanakae TaxID=230148 RepID=A0A4Z2H1L9_9TELE|nr:hypothetical protein EYF80_030031 [Liparis tanakae]
MFLPPHCLHRELLVGSWESVPTGALLRDTNSSVPLLKWCLAARRRAEYLWRRRCYVTVCVSLSGLSSSLNHLNPVALCSETQDMVILHRATSDDEMAQWMLQAT